MNIVIFGAGAIGSLIGAKLSKNNYVILHGRKSHIDKIKKDGLKIIGKTIILTIQNGLDNIEIIKKWVNASQIMIGVTTEGSLFVKPGYIKHTGTGITKIGVLDGHHSNIIKQIVNLFNESKINTILSENILKEIWIKAIINSCVNPLTTIFRCKNGYLLRNPIGC